MSKRDKLDFSYTNDRGKRVSGSAAFMHYVYTEKGSVQAYNDEVGAEYIAAYIRDHSDDINTNYNKRLKRRLFKVV